MYRLTLLDLLKSMAERTCDDQMLRYILQETAILKESDSSEASCNCNSYKEIRCKINEAVEEYIKKMHAEHDEKKKSYKELLENRYRKFLEMEVNEELHEELKEIRHVMRDMYSKFQELEEHVEAIVHMRATNKDM